MTVTSTLVQRSELKLSDADANLSSDDMRVECLLERFRRERVANKSNDPVLNPIAGLGV